MRWLFAAAILLFTAVIAGCSNNVNAEVEGKVSYAGEPIDVGTITFIPTDGTGVKSGALIDGGSYKVDSKTGPAPGPHRVEIRWAKPTGASSKNEYGETIAKRQEGLPAKYHDQSTLKADIKSGDNVLDFQLEK